MVKAAYEALRQLTDPVEVAQRRGVGVSKVFEG
jgi:small subunit ribosomal protein S5